MKATQERTINFQAEIKLKTVFRNDMYISHQNFLNYYLFFFFFLLQFQVFTKISINYMLNFRFQLRDGH